MVGGVSLWDLREEGEGVAARQRGLDCGLVVVFGGVGFILEGRSQEAIPPTGVEPGSSFEELRKKLRASRCEMRSMSRFLA